MTYLSTAAHEGGSLCETREGALNAVVHSVEEVQALHALVVGATSISG